MNNSHLSKLCKMTIVFKVLISIILIVSIKNTSAITDENFHRLEDLVGELQVKLNQVERLQNINCKLKLI